MTEETKNPDTVIDDNKNKYDILLDNIFYDVMDIDSAVSIINNLVATGCAKGMLNLHDIAKVTKALLTIQSKLNNN